MPAWVWAIAVAAARVILAGAVLVWHLGRRPDAPPADGMPRASERDGVRPRSGRLKELPDYNYQDWDW